MWDKDMLLTDVKCKKHYCRKNSTAFPILMVCLYESIQFKANTFKFYDSIHDLPDHIVEGFIPHIQTQSEMIEADYQQDEKQFKARTKKTEQFLHELMQVHDQLQIFAMQLGFTAESLSAIQL